MKKHMLRKLLTFVFTLTFIVSTIMGTLPAFSLNSDKTDLVNVINGFHYVTPGKIGETKNILKGKLPYLNEYVAPAGTVAAEDKSKLDAGGNPEKLTDGDYTTNYGSTANTFYNGTEGVVDGSVYNKIAFDLGKSTEITDILVAHYKASSGFGTSAFKIFVSNEKNTLFNNENLVADVKNTAAVAQNVISTQSGKELSGQFVGIIVTNPVGNCAGSAYNYSTRINEFAVFAADTSVLPAARASVESSETNLIPDLDSANGELNITAGKIAKYYSNLMGDGADKRVEALVDAKAKVLTDGDTSTDTEAKASNNYVGAFTGHECRFGEKDPNEFFVGRMTAALTYDFGSTYELTKLTLINHATNAFAAGHYRVYASDSESKLFDSSNFVIEVKNTEGNQRDLITFHSGIKARYIGIRVIDPCSNYNHASLKDAPRSAYLRLREIAVFGIPTATESDRFVVTADGSFETNTSLGEENILKGLKAQEIKYYTPTTSETVADTGKLTDGEIVDDAGQWTQKSFKFFDGDKVIGNGINLGDYRLDITFNLGGIAKIKGFEVFNSASFKGGLANHKYQIYASNSAADLFETANMLVDYTNDSKAHNSFALANEEVIEAQYYGIRILDPTCSKDLATIRVITNIYPRIRELTLYGQKPKQTASNAVSTDETAKLPTDFEGTNLALQSNFDSKFMDLSGNYVNAIPYTDNADLIDGDLTNEYRTPKSKFADVESSPEKWLGNGITEGSIYQDLIFDLKYIAKIDGIAVINHSSNKLATYKYDIYFANKLDDLFKGEPFYKMVNEAGKQRNIFDISAMNNNSLKEARFVGIRVIDPTFAKPSEVTASNAYLRLLELAIFGTLTTEGGDPEPDRTVINDNNATIPLDMGTNIALGKQPKVYVKNKEGYNSSIKTTGLSLLSDGNVKTEFTEYNKFAELTDDGKLNVDHSSFGLGDWYVDITYDFLSEINLDGFSMIHHKTKDLITRHYAVYVSSNKSSLFSEESMAYEVRNDQAYRRNAVNLKDKNMSKKGRYVAIRIFAPTEDPKLATGIYGIRKDANNKDEVFNQISTRIMEFAVYGTYTDPNFEYVPNCTPMKTAPADSYFDGNLLLNKTPREVAYNSQVYKGYNGAEKVGTITNGLTITPYKEEIDKDGKVKKLTHFDFSKLKFTATDGTQYVDFSWDLGKNYNLSKFAMLSMITEQTAYYTGWYRLYVSEDLDLLFDEESIVFEYNALAEENADEICRGQEKIFKNNQAVGRHVAVRILNPVYTATTMMRPRIVEVGIWGEEAIADMSPTNLTQDMPVSAYLGEAGNLKEIDELSLAEIKNLADGNKSTGATIKTGGEKLQIIYNLCQDVDIYSILINSLKGKTNLKNYKVFAANSQVEVLSDKALVYTHKGSSATGKKEFAVSKNMRFLRLEITDKSDKIYIGDIQIIGPKSKLLKNKNLNKNLQSTNYGFFFQDLKTGEIEEFLPERKNMNPAIIHDGSSTVATSIRGGINGKKSMNITIDLGDNRNVNLLRIDFPQRSDDYYPSITKIYFGSDGNELEELDAKPIATFKGAPKNNCFETEFAPKMGRYVRICFEKAAENKILDEMIVALNEVTIMGTSVVGMNPGESSVMDFQDKKLGIKWGIIKSTENDVINNVATSKVWVSDSTNWQKRSLEKNPYLKVVGGKNYTFKFYDIVGNEITDLEGRSVEVSFKHRDGMNEDTAMLGYSGNKWYIEAYDTDSNVYQGYATAYAETTEISSITFSMLNIISSDDEYWSTIGELEDYGDEKPQYPPATEEDITTSTNTIVTEDGDFHIDPQAALRLPIDAQMFVNVKTYTITPEVYMAVEPLTDPNYIAAIYSINLMQGDIDVAFNGQIEVKAKIPDAIKGYFTGYKLIHVTDIGEGEFIDFEREGDYIYFKTWSLSDFALIGEGYTSDGSAVLDDSFIGDNSNGDSTSPNTGDASTGYYIIVSLISLAAILLLNGKKFGKIKE